MISLKSISDRCWQASKSLYVVTIMIGLFGLFSAAATIFDDRTLVGAPIWFKPIKFGISILIYNISLMWILGHVTRWKRTARAIGFIVAANLLFDTAWVVIQTVRGVRSHFNITTAFDAKFYALVGTSINLVMMMNFVAIVVVLMERMTSKTKTTALTFGLLTSTIGGLTAIPMTIQTTPAQRAMDEANVRREVAGGHNFGVEEGGPGLPLLGWSTIGGDGRVPHFFGLHGLQVLPLLGAWVASRYRNRLSDARCAAIVAVVGLAYIGITLLLLWQALRGQSVIAPDIQIIGAFGGVLAVAGVMLFAIVRWPQAQRHVSPSVPS